MKNVVRKLQRKLESHHNQRPVHQERLI